MQDTSSELYENYFKALMEISQAVISDHYLDDVLKLIVLVTARVTGVEICSLWLLDEQNGEKIIRLKTTQAIDQVYVKDRILHLNEGVVGMVATQQRPLIIKDVKEYSLFKEKEMAQKLGLVAMAGVPLKVGDDVIGVLNCFTDKPHDFPKSEINLIATVANQAALAIHNTKLAMDARNIREQLRTRKLVEKAKEIIIARRKISADESFRWIQKKSMDTRRSMSEIAEAIILSEELSE
ncbi:GAF domain-containing protein [Desulfogranum marinum]|uniref:GAF domain-containing protein n=1 Tax=Desulfogranum marinum TaxID=453220 RepID=UPI0019663806|nr:GAF domain-containing protein [Desulfogranum marinum]MBM9511872.1 GAF and ANTAR domain-containing protein [Desulfogranum marinum]